MSVRMSSAAVAWMASAVALALPAAASATTFTVDPGAAAGCSTDHVCKTLGAANAALADGDVVNVRDGAYTEPHPLVITRRNVTFSAVDPGKVTFTTTAGSTGDPVIQIGDGVDPTSGQNTVLSGFVVSTPVNGGEAVRINTTGTSVTACFLARLQNTSGADAPVYHVAELPPGGVNSLSRSIVVQSPTPGSASAAVVGSTNTSLQLSDDYVLAGSTDGPAATITGADAAKPNTILRSQLVATNPSSSALVVNSPSNSPGDKPVALDSTLLSGGSAAATISASTAGTQVLYSSAGDITINGAHVTVVGGARPFNIDAEANGQPPNAAGAIALNLDRSIVHGTQQGTAKNYNGSALPIPLPTDPVPTTAKVRITRSDTTQSPANTGLRNEIATVSTVNNPDSKVFVDAPHLNYHLRADSPDIDQADAALPTDSPTDLDGQPRQSGGATDYGADEFVNLPPTAVIKASTTSPKQNQVVTFDASSSKDPEAGTGGGLVGYLWDYGDGKMALTTTPTTTHSYTDVGSYNAKVTTVDNFQATATSAPVTLGVTDGLPPHVTVSTPKRNASYRIYKTRTTKLKNGKKKRTKVRTDLTFSGFASDESGVKSVEIALRRRSGSRCVYFDGKSRNVVASCSKPRYFFVSVADGVWRWKLKRSVRFRTGSYTLLARGTDNNGVVSDPVSVAFRFR